jgi:basic amino acid/polyamine antiporter, APA family
VGHVTAAGEEPGKLQPVLGPWQLLCIGISAIIGSGIFVIPGPAAAQFAGPAIIVAFLIAAVGCALAGLCYAELAAMCPIAGSAYSYTTYAFGRLPGWIIGWLLILEYSFAAGIITQSCGSYSAGLLPASVHGQAFASVLALVALVAITGLAIRGIQLSARVVVASVIIKITVIVLVIALGAPYVNPVHWRPFIPHNTGRWGEYGWSGIMRAAGIVFYTYLGFDAVSVSAQEARNPQRDVPFGLIGSLAVCSLLFILMMAVVTGLSDYRALDVADPVAVAVLAGTHLPWLVRLIDVGATVGMLSVLLVLLMAQSRILFTMAMDGLLPAPLARLHARWKTPVIGTLLTAVLAGALAEFVPISVLGQMVSVGVLSAFIAVALVVLVWRRRRPLAPRPFRTPWVPAVPIGAVLVCSYMAANLPIMTWWRFCAWVILGFVIYWILGVRAPHPSSD